MAKCFLTGVDLEIEQAYILDLGAAFRACKDLRQRLATIERLIQQFGSLDDASVFDPKNRVYVTKKRHRLISSAMAQALSSAYPGERLFLSWSEWRSRRHAVTHPAVKEGPKPDPIAPGN